MLLSRRLRHTSLLATRNTGSLLQRRALLSSLVQPNTSILEVARLRSLNLGRLRSRAPQEVHELQQACEEDGFFYLDLRNIDHGRILRDWKSIQSLMSPWFNKDLDEKMKYNCGTVRHGYNPMGTYAGLAENSRDGHESIKITDAARGASPPVLPDLYLENRHLLDRFMDECREISMDLVSCLSDSLGLQGSSRFEQQHRSYKASNTCLDLLYYPKQDDTARFGQVKHTDTGTFTLLFTSHPGLEILSPDSGLWGMVEPVEGHIVVNVGDTLRNISQNRFYSSVHRVSPVFKDSQQSRLVVGYFFRAENDAIVTDNAGNPMTVLDWHDHKYDTFQAPLSVLDAGTILTGGMEGSIGLRA